MCPVATCKSKIVKRPLVLSSPQHRPKQLEKTGEQTRSSLRLHAQNLIYALSENLNSSGNVTRLKMSYFEAYPDIRENVKLSSHLHNEARVGKGLMLVGVVTKTLKLSSIIHHLRGSHIDSE